MSKQGLHVAPTAL